MKLFQYLCLSIICLFFLAVNGSIYAEPESAAEKLYQDKRDVQKDLKKELKKKHKKDKELKKLVNEAEEADDKRKEHYKKVIPGYTTADKDQKKNLKRKYEKGKGESDKVLQELDKTKDEKENAIRKYLYKKFPEYKKAVEAAHAAYKKYKGKPSRLYKWVNDSK